MKNPPIVMTRGKGWNNPAWELHRLALEKAAEKAERAVRAQNVSYQTWKLGIINRFTPAPLADEVGTMIDASHFVLRIDRRNQGVPSTALIAAWAGEMLHEVVHCARYERTIGKTVMELAASEGLAYVSQELFRRQAHPKKANMSFLDQDLAPNPRLFEQFSEVADLSITSPAGAQWSTWRPHGVIRNVDYLGLQRVYAQVERGYSISDLLNQPAGDVLGL